MNVTAHFDNLIVLHFCGSALLKRAYHSEPSRFTPATIPEPGDVVAAWMVSILFDIQLI